MSNKQGYFEEKGINGVAKNHSEAAKIAADKSNWKELSDAEIVPLVEDDPDVAPKKMKGALAMIDPIQQILDIRNIKYEKKFAFVREALQNVDRSTEEEGHNLYPDVNITINNDSFTIYDDAGGITKDKLSNLFDFGVSGWEGGAVKENPFGQGFLSFVILFDRVEVLSNNVHAVFDLEDILQRRAKKVFSLNEAYEYETTRSFDAFGRGEFTAICTKPTEFWDEFEAYEMAVESGKTLAFKSLTINGENIKLQSFDAPYGAIDISKYSSSGEKVIDGWIQPSGDTSEYPFFYHFRKPVGHFFGLPGISGKVNILDNRYGDTIENRDRWQQSTKGRGIILTKNHIVEEAKKFALDIVKHGDDEAVKTYEEFIDHYLDYNQYKYLINFALIGGNTVKAISDNIKEENPDISEETFIEEVKERMSSKSRLIESAEKTIRSESEIAEDYNRKEAEIEARRKEIQEEKFEADHVEEEILDEESEALEEEISDLEKQERKERQREKERQKRLEEGDVRLTDVNKITFWVESEYVPTFLEQIKEAEYHGYQIAIAYNHIQKRVFDNESVGGDYKSKKMFLHISNFIYTYSNSVKMKSIGPKTKEEARIEWVINTFINSVPEFEDVDFHIADYDFIKTMRIPGTDIEETKETRAIAYAEGKDVYMMREIGYGNTVAGEVQGFYGAKSLKPYLKYNNFPLENKTIGWGDIALFLRVVNLISHEMAHSIYGTTDNTQEHFEAMGKIIAKFNAVITEHQGRTVLGEGKQMSLKNRRALGVEKEDTVAITYFAGTDIEMEEAEISPTKAKKIKTFKEGDYLLVEDDLAAFITNVEGDSYSAAIIRGYEANPESVKVLKTEAIEYPFKKGRLYRDSLNYETLFVTDIIPAPWDSWENGIRIMKFTDYNKTEIKNKEFIDTQSAIGLNLEPYNKKEQAKFIHEIALDLIDARMNSYGYVSIPYLVDYFERILPINFQGIQYIIDKKYSDKYEKTGTKTYDGAEEYYFKE